MHSYLTVLTAETEGLRRRVDLQREVEQARRMRGELALGSGAPTHHRAVGVRLLHRITAAFA